MDVVVVAEKSKGVNIRLAYSIIEEIEKEARIADSRLGLVVFSRRPLPLVDLAGSHASVSEAYNTCPILEGRPEPLVGLLEAYEMIEDYRPVLPSKGSIALLWSAAVRPRAPLREAVEAMENHGVSVKIILLKPSPPKWLPRLLGPGLEPDKVRFVRKTTNIQKLASAIVKEA
jgi:hypothetical protein